MALPPDVCPECGAPRPRRAAGCPNCGRIFQDVPAAAAGLPAERPAAPRAAQSTPQSASHPDDARAESGAGCNSCLLLLAICAGLTVLAGVVLYLLVRDDVSELGGMVQREFARQGLDQLAGALETWAEDHDGRLPDSLDDLDVPDTWRVDTWDGPIRYEPAEDRLSARLQSLGADREPGGEDLDADLERAVTLP